MYQWLDFMNFIFWISIIGFLINYSNFLFLFLFSEITWIVIYTYSVLTGLSIDDFTSLSNSFFCLGFAGIEFTIGFLLLISFKKFNISYNFLENNLKILNNF